jgi:hypothetical protein
MDAHVTWTGNRMSDADYERERAQIRATYGDSKGSAGARFEQELAKLFHRSGWTQEKLAEKEGKNQKTISRWLVFGRFLDFRPSGPKLPNPAFANLTERKFRGYWERTDKAEGKRLDKARGRIVMALLRRRAPETGNELA